MITATCKCGKVVRAKDKYAGRVVKCPECQQPLTIPDLERNDDDVTFWDDVAELDGDFGKETLTPPPRQRRRSQAKNKARKASGNNRKIALTSLVAASLLSLLGVLILKLFNVMGIDSVPVPIFSSVLGSRWERLIVPQPTFVESLVLVPAMTVFMSLIFFVLTKHAQQTPEDKARIANRTHLVFGRFFQVFGVIFLLLPVIAVLFPEEDSEFGVLPILLVGLIGSAVCFAGGYCLLLKSRGERLRAIELLEEWRDSFGR